ncbi:hypothetical protein [Robinsoniella peoriensis]
MEKEKFNQYINTLTMILSDIDNEQFLRLIIKISEKELKQSNKF